MKKRILLLIVGLSLLLGGCGANQTQKKTDTHKEKAKTEKGSRRLRVQRHLLQCLQKRILIKFQ